METNLLAFYKMLGMVLGQRQVVDTCDNGNNLLAFYKMLGMVLGQRQVVDTCDNGNKSSGVL